jgi:hypothetical protein
MEHRLRECRSGTPHGKPNHVNRSVKSETQASLDLAKLATNGRRPSLSQRLFLKSAEEGKNDFRPVNWAVQGEFSGSLRGS